MDDKDYPRHLIRGTVEYERYISDGFYCGWFVSPPLLDIFKRKICRHEFTLWCTNLGVENTRLVEYRYCNKCGREEVRQ